MRSRKEEHIIGGEKIRSVILGLNDGLISTFTLLIGVAAATLASTGSNAIVILTGLAAMVSGAISMGLGEYISKKSEYNYVKNELKKERAEIELFPEEEKEEVREVFENMGLEGETLNACVKKITSNKDTWLEFLTKSELGLEEPDSPILGAILTFLSFVFCSFLTVFAYFFNLGLISLIISSIISFSMLFIVGILKTKITGEPKVRSGLEMILIGIVAFIASYGIGTLLEQLIATV
ncbi:MAG: VIT1/CCC1 transporter family protein [Candidatus Thorarchaeota archaeon]